ncbi:MAG: ChbG/HpnK family deacetylase [Bosea sp.]|jgi:predicted glycoside hydrolase/deacetylase ChbG (UPF0249 family)|nr:ChbG/HpnK family deacetylase [Bosea sp. (in: a-proteobacteria)]
MSRLVLCADDYALTDGVSRAILELLASRRISATGAMTSRPGWKGWAAPLLVYADVADLGVHLNLTCAAPLGSMPNLCREGRFPGLRTVIRAALTSAAARDEIAREIARQLAAFEDATGRAPDFIDGHQHVHAMPGVRSLLLDAVARRYAPGSLYIRDPADSIAAIRNRGVAVPKALVIAALSRGFGSAARKRGFPVNAGFSGISPFDPARDFARDLERFVIAPGPRHLMMCHPGFVDDELRALDPVVETRMQEFEVLRHGALPGGFQPARFSQLVTLPGGAAVA